MEAREWPNCKWPNAAQCGSWDKHWPAWSTTQLPPDVTTSLPSAHEGPCTAPDAGNTAVDKGGLCPHRTYILVENKKT